MKTRITGPANSYYHVFSRIIERRFYLGSKEKEAFVSLLWRVARFSGVKILTYCILDNHFHILIQVPERVPVDDDDLLCRLRILYGIGPRKGPYDPVREFMQSKNNPALRKRLRAKYQRRMYDLSEFMRTLKLRYSFWYNRTHNRMGTLWDMRFKSVLIEGRLENMGNPGNQALVMVAAYIDLNSVRAGVVENPADYRWCGYAAALAGGMEIQQGLAHIYSLRPAKMDWNMINEMYCCVLYAGDIMNKQNRNSTSTDMLRHRVRYFTQGAVLGSQAFVDEAFRNHRWMFGKRRKTGARKMRGKSWGNLYAARAAQHEKQE